MKRLTEIRDTEKYTNICVIGLYEGGKWEDEQK